MSESQPQEPEVRETPDTDKAPQPKEKRGKTYNIREVDEYQGEPRFYGNQYTQVGEVVDMWADLIDGFGAKARVYDILCKWHG